mmetsp:Transcript_61693/g.139008  ORF Transcript_61693/g.139008 Transcript_61693/m.139008 type:complete len:211 (-) Transcript_61693:486-1118(-)
MVPCELPGRTVLRMACWTFSGFPLPMAFATCWTSSELVFFTASVTVEPVFRSALATWGCSITFFTCGLAKPKTFASPSPVFLSASTCGLIASMCGLFSMAALAFSRPSLAFSKAFGSNASAGVLGMIFLTASASAFVLEWFSRAEGLVLLRLSVAFWRALLTACNVSTTPTLGLSLSSGLAAAAAPAAAVGTFADAASGRAAFAAAEEVP